MKEKVEQIVYPNKEADFERRRSDRGEFDIEENLRYGETRYIFYEKGVVIGIQEKNRHSDLPALYFVTAQGYKSNGNKRFSMPRVTGAGQTVTMKDVVECLEHVLAEVPYRQFWINFHSEIKDGLTKDVDGIPLTLQQRARLLLFRKLIAEHQSKASLTPDPTTDGYILSIL